MLCCEIYFPIIFSVFFRTLIDITGTIFKGSCFNFFQIFSEHRFDRSELIRDKRKKNMTESIHDVTMS